MDSSKSQLPIIFHSAIESAFDSWAECCGRHAESLRSETKAAIYDKHELSRIDHPSHKGGEKQPDIYTLALDSCEVVYSVESDKIVVRGYQWESEDEDCGGFYAEACWHDAPSFSLI